MKCPNCNVNLAMADRHGVEIDYCPECRGIWLDRGELDKIIERSIHANTDEESNSTYFRKSYDPRIEDHRRKKKKKESFLSDLFDF